jgi:hypothetical protein
VNTDASRMSRSRPGALETHRVFLMNGHPPRSA